MGHAVRPPDLPWTIPSQATQVSSARRTRGCMAHLSGALAEDSVARLLEQKGMTVLARRWRGKAGEIDLIARDGSCLIFVEVKQSATHEDAACRLVAAQQGRIMRAALEYCDAAGLAPLPDMRFDAALVDSQGRVEILERAFEEAGA
jgi:putative endonuclease